METPKVSQAITFNAEEQRRLNLIQSVNTAREQRPVQLLGVARVPAERRTKTAAEGEGDPARGAQDL